MDQLSRPPNIQARTAPASSQTQTRTAPAPAQAQAHTKSAPVTQTVAQGPPPEHLTIDPVPSPNSDQSIEFDWESAMIGTNRSLGCTVTSVDGHDLTVSLEQATYQRSLQGSGVVKIVAIPVGMSGTQGKLTARDTVTGAVATITWQWHARGAGAGTLAPPKAKGFLGRLFSGRAQTAAARAGSQPKAAASVAQRLGARAASAITLRFFGHEAVGQRFAFILDMSGSMSGQRWNACRNELERALNALPERVQFFVILFSTAQQEAPGQTGWMYAERARVDDAISWIATIHPSGGTCPAGSFRRVFSLAEPPDIIYFLTDGELQGFVASDCAALRGTSQTIVNTIALENQQSAEALETMATESGGQYIHIAAAPTA